MNDPKSSGLQKEENGMAVAAEASEVPPAAFTFQVQSEFHEIPLSFGADEEAHAARMRGFARDYWGDQEEREPLRKLLTAMYSANAEEMIVGGAVYQALGIFPIGGTADGTQVPERVSRCTLVVSVRDLDNPDPGIAAAGIGEMLARSDEDGEVQLITLPAGPAVVHIAASRAVWAPPEGEQGEGQERFFIRIEVWLPFPDEDRILLLSLSTPDVEDLFHYQAVLADIADTITFGDGDDNVNDHEDSAGTAVGLPESALG